MTNGGAGTGNDDENDKYQSLSLLAIVGRIHQWQVDFPHKGPVLWNHFHYDIIITFFVKM